MELPIQQQPQRYVMKHLSPGLFPHRGQYCARDITNAVADLVGEALYLSKLRHPHIIRLLGLTLGGTSVLQRPKAVADDYFLILDRMDETLDHRIRSWRKGHRRVNNNNTSIFHVLIKTHYALQIADAVSYLHDHQILYRDLKPENIGLLKAPSTTGSSTADNNQYAIADTVQLFDFGLARELDELVASTRLYPLSASGTRRYMAPEIFNPPFHYSYPADVYSFAMVVYELLALQKPFADFTSQSHDELVCRLGGRPKLKDIAWPHDHQPVNDDNTSVDNNSNMDDPTQNNSRRLGQQMERILQQSWKQDFRQRPTMCQVYQQLADILKSHGYDYAQPSVVARESSWSRQFPNRLPTHHDDSTMVLQKKPSTSEWTQATDPMASDSELDDDNTPCPFPQRLSHESARSGK